MKYNKQVLQKPGLIYNWNEIELPDGALPLHIEVFKETISGTVNMVQRLDDIFGKPGEYKYNRETGEILRSRKDGEGFDEYKIFTKIYYLIPIDKLL